MPKKRDISQLFAHPSKKPTPEGHAPWDTRLPNIFFVGREHERQWYEAFLQNGPYWVWVITGQPGCGKSTLLLHLANLSASKKIPTALLNFARLSSQIDQLTILDKLAALVGPHCDARQFQEFKDTMKNVRETLAEAEKHKTVQSINQYLFAFEQSSIEQPTQHVQVPKILDKGPLIALATNNFYELLGTFKKDRLVIMFDISDGLIEPESSNGGQLAEWLFNQFIPELHDSMQWQQHCLFVIASREELSLSTCEPGVKYDELLLLEEPEVHQYLQHIGMQDVAQRNYVFEITHGHPLCMSVVSNIWLKEGGKFETEEPASELTTRGLLRRLGRHILDQNAIHFDDLTRYGVLLRRFNQPALQAIFPELFTRGKEKAQFGQLMRSTYIIHSQEDGYYSFHQLWREILATDIRERQPEIWQEYHHRALDYFVGFSPRPPEWYYHALAHDEKSGLIAWKEAIEQAYADGKRERIDALLQLARDRTLAPSAATRAKIAYEQGRYFYTEQQWEEALKSCRQSLELCRGEGYLLGQAQAYTVIADVHRFRTDVYSDLEAALKYYQRACSIYKQERDPQNAAHMQHGIANVLYRIGDLDAAWENYQRAFDAYDLLDDRANKAYVRRSMGDVLARRSHKDTEGAAEQYRLALTEFPEMRESDPLGQAYIHKSLADQQQELGNWEAALASYYQALTLYQKKNDLLGQAWVQRAMGDAEQKRDRGAALKHYQQALTLYEQSSDSSAQAALDGQASIYKAIGDIERARGRWNPAWQNYTNALERYIQLYDSSGLASVQQAMGNVERERGDWDAAVQHYDESRMAALDKKDYKMAAYFCQEAGRNLQKLNDQRIETILAFYAKALAYYEEEVQDYVGAAYVCQLMGELEQSHKHLDTALGYYSQALEHHQQVRKKSEEDHRRMEKKRGLRLEDYTSMDELERSREGAIKGAAYVSQLMGELEQSRKNWPEALGYYRQSLDYCRQISNHQGAAHVYRLIGEVEQVRGNLKDVSEHFEEALKHYRQVRQQHELKPEARTGASAGAAHVYQVKGEIEQARGNLDEAFQYYDSALECYKEALEGYKEIEAETEDEGFKATAGTRADSADAGAAHVYQVKGEIEQARGNPDEALQYYNKALEYYEEKKDPERAAYVYRLQGDVLRACSELNMALESYQKSSDRYEQVRASLSRSHQRQETLTSLADNYRAMGDIQRTRNALREALDNYADANYFYKKAENTEGQAHTYHAIGDIHKSLGEFEEALENYRKALERYPHNSEGWAKVHQTMSELR